MIQPLSGILRRKYGHFLGFDFVISVAMLSLGRFSLAVYHWFWRSLMSYLRNGNQSGQWAPCQTCRSNFSKIKEHILCKQCKISKYYFRKDGIETSHWKDHSQEFRQVLKDLFPTQNEGLTLTLKLHVICLPSSAFGNRHLLKMLRPLKI